MEPKPATFSPTPSPRPFADRLRIAVALVVAATAIGVVLRVLLYASFHDGPFATGDLLLALATGLVFDAIGFGAAMQVGFVLWSVFRLALLPVRLLTRLLPFGRSGSALDTLLALDGVTRPFARVPLLAVALGVLGFDAIAQWFFFEEFNARYNHIALDYLIYPHEVVGNIFESYNMPAVFTAAAVLGIVACIPIARWSRGMQFPRLSFGQHARAEGISLALGGLCFFLGWALPGHVSENRIVAEIAQNGFAQLWRAFWTAHLDYELYYATTDRAAARAHAAEVLGHEKPTPEAMAAQPGAYTSLRTFEPRYAGVDYDVVVVLEESFGSEFIGVLGHPERRTSPGVDRWSKEALLLTNLTATGNRTVRGMEGVLCSFPPLPGDSIVKRNHSENVASIARVMKQVGARTSFFYGGIGLFDSMKPFTMDNGWDEFVEQTDFPDDAFRTIWGVADEFVFDRMLETQIECRKKGQRYCFTLLSVSNHKPYNIPPGRITPLTPHPSRENAVAYSDWALATYLDKAKAAGLLDHTVVLAVADHGARVYGKEEIPAASYRIPALIVHPDPSLHGVRWNRLCSQIDLAPTVLSMAGVRYRAPFFGEDLNGLPETGGRAFLQHNRDIGILTDQELIVLGLQKRTYFYSRTGRDSDVFTRLEEKDATPAMLARRTDAVSVFQTAYELYTNERYKLP